VGVRRARAGRVRRDVRHHPDDCRDRVPDYYFAARAGPHVAAAQILCAAGAGGAGCADGEPVHDGECGRELW